MKVYEKIIIWADILLTIFYGLILLSSNSSVDGFAQLIGAVGALSLIPFIIGKIAVKKISENEKKIGFWKIFTKTYLPIIIIVLIGIFSSR